jgi:SNF2 family DNA or RNA helicase
MTRPTPSAGAGATQLSGMSTKSVVFCSFTSMLDVIQARLEKEAIAYARLDGTMSALQREAAVTAFQTNPDIHVFLVSLTAGGTGLTLTAAANAFVMDPHCESAVVVVVSDRCCARRWVVTVLPLS